jgi:hypothetical protein
MRTLALVASTAFALVAASPAQPQEPPAEKPDPAITDGSAQRALDAAKARWRARGPASYRFRVRRSCFCPPAYTTERRVTVRGGRPVRPPEQVEDFATVPRLFRIVRRAIADGAVDLDVTYDKRYGYPRAIFVDRSRMIADEESGYGARYLKPIG